MLFSFHGGGGTGLIFRIQLEDGTYIGEEVIQPFPDGFGGLWNAGGSWETAQDDVQRILDLITEMSLSNRVDSAKIDLCGHSLGAMFVYRLLIEHPTMFRRAICFSGVPLVPNDGAFAGKIMHIHGELDDNVPIAGGQGIGLFTYPPLLETLADFTNADITLHLLPTGVHTMSSLTDAIINDLGTTKQQLISDFILGA